MHPIRRLRGEIGFTQGRFAALIGVSTSALQQIELGAMKLTSKIEGRIVSVTGVKGACLRGRRGKLVTSAGEPFTRKHFERRDERAAWKASEFERKCVAKELQRRVDVILEAAWKLKRFDIVESELWDVLDALRKTHGLHKLTDDLLKRGPDPRERWTALASRRKGLLFTDTGVRKISAKTTIKTITGIAKNTESKRVIVRLSRPPFYSSALAQVRSDDGSFFVMTVAPVETPLP